LVGRLEIGRDIADVWPDAVQVHLAWLLSRRSLRAGRKDERK